MAMAVAARPHVVDAGMERRTALMAAAAEGSVAQLAQLLENGAQMSEIDDLGMCALSFSAAHGHTDAAKALCVRGANVNATDKRGRTPLMHAVLGGHLDTTVQLALIGANVAQQDDGCCSALDHAIDMSNRAIALALLLITTGKFSRPLEHLLTLARLRQLHTWVRDKQGKNQGAMGTVHAAHPPPAACRDGGPAPHLSRHTALDRSSLECRPSCHPTMHIPCSHRVCTMQVLHQYAACLTPREGQAVPAVSAEQRTECVSGVLAVLLWASQHALTPLAENACTHLSSLAAHELCGLQDEAGFSVLHILVLAGRGETCRALAQALPRADAAKLLMRRDLAGRLPHEISEAEMPAQSMAAIRAARRDVEALWRDVDRAAGGAASGAAERARSAGTSPMAGARAGFGGATPPAGTSPPAGARAGRGGAVRRRSGSHTALPTLASHSAIPASSSVDQLRENAQTVAAADDLLQLFAGGACARAPRPRGTKPYQRPGKRGGQGQGKECWLPGGLWWEEPHSAIPAGRQPGELQGWDPLGAERTQQNRVEQKQLLLEKEEAVQDLESRDDAVAFCHRLKASCSNDVHSATSTLASAPITETVDDSVLDRQSQFKRLAAWGGFRRQFVQDEVQEDEQPAPTGQTQGRARAEPASRVALPAAAASVVAPAREAAAQLAVGAAVDPQRIAPLQQRLYAKKAEVLAARQALDQLLEEERQLTAQLMSLAMGTPQPMDR